MGKGGLGTREAMGSIWLRGREDRGGRGRGNGNGN